MYFYWSHGPKIIRLTTLMTHVEGRKHQSFLPSTQAAIQVSSTFCFLQVGEPILALSLCYRISFLPGYSCF